MKKAPLKYAALLLAMTGAIAIIYIFAASMRPSARAIADAQYLLDVSTLTPGKPLIFKDLNRPIFVYRPTQEEWNDIKFLDSHVWDRNYGGYETNSGVFVFWGISTHVPCVLVHIPKGKSTLSNVAGVWLGGYFDPCGDSSYDYAGRTIKTYTYTKNGYNAEVPNLKSPRFKIQNSQMIINYQQ